jgi:hypothetical protein
VVKDSRKNVSVIVIGTEFGIAMSAFGFLATTSVLLLSIPED